MGKSMVTTCICYVINTIYVRRAMKRVYQPIYKSRILCSLGDTATKVLHSTDYEVIAVIEPIVKCQVQLLLNNIETSYYVGIL